jgi:MarR family transcriptional repressor of emrRAB
MHDDARTANLLGATALAVTDLALGDTTRAAGFGPSSAAALVVLSSGGPLGVTRLGRRIGLSQPATARMVDTLEDRGLVARGPREGRSVLVSVTPEGRRTADALLAARGTPLAGLLAALDQDERRQLDALLAKLLTRLYAQVGDADLLCRLCDRGACVRGAVCPVGEAERGGG